MNRHLPEIFYEERIDDLQKTLAVYQTKGRYLASGRLFSILIALFLIGYAWQTSAPLVLPVALVFVGLFLFLVSLDINNNSKIANTERLININKTEIQCLNHDLNGMPEGNEFKQAHHDYSHDLDIFGHASLYQYINRCQSQQGQHTLASYLLHPSPNSIIIKRQSAVKELSTKAPWRQEFQSEGMNDGITIATENNVLSWLTRPYEFINKKYWQILRFLLPGLSLLAIILHIAGVLKAPLFYGFIFLMFIISLLISKRVMPQYLQLNKIASEIDTLSGSISLIESLQAESELLKSIREKYGDGSVKASVIVRQFRKILDRLDYRLNPIVFLPLNTILFWDLQQVIALENWKREYGNKIKNWYSGIGELEALSSLANLSFNHPQWSFPTLSDEPGIFISKDLAHPLIPGKQNISSSFNTIGLSKISLVTGSNMAGKSTFLRSVGVNTVLAMAGSAVCASSLEISNWKVISSMRVSDNLEENTSTFYAELKKLKFIIEAVNRKENILILLDEILRGTNSADRHTGSTALIKQLINHDAVAIVATHDLELAKLNAEYPNQIHNYHFDVQVSGEELYFDYKLKEGVCTSMNASLLMKKIGIEL